MKSKGKIAMICATAAILAVAVTSCGGATQPACLVFDASRSTQLALQDYTRAFRQTLDNTAETGGRLAVVVMATNPKVEAVIEHSEDFSDLSGVDKGPERNAAVDDFAGRIDRSVRLAAASATSTAPGSGILAAIDLIAGQDCSSVEVLSDGLEAYDVHMLREDVLSPAGRARLLDRLDRRRLLPDLGGLELRFPFGGYLPQGTGRALSKARLDAVPKFWEDYAARTGASLSWRR